VNNSKLWWKCLCARTK